MFIADKNITSKDFDNEYREHRQRYLKTEDRLIEILGLCNFTGKKVLDLGGGAGNLGHEVYKKGNNVTVVDFSEEAIKLAKDNCEECESIQADILDFPVGKFDVVIMADVAEEMYPGEFEIVMEKIDSPIFIFSSPTHENYLKMSTHLTIYTREELLEIIGKRGYILEEEIEYPDRLIARFKKDGRISN